MESEHVAALEAVKETIWLWKCLIVLGVVPLVASLLILFYDNNEAMVQSKEPRDHWKGQRFEKKHHLICEIVMKGDVAIEKIASMENLSDLFMLWG